MSKKMVTLHILDLLKKYSSKDKRLGQNEIRSILNNEYGDDISSNTLSAYLKELRVEKYISGNRGCYYNPPLQSSELRILIDGVLFGKHIDKKHGDKLIKALKDLSPVEMENKVKNVHYLEAFNRTDNDSLVEVVDKCDEAITKDKKIRIKRVTYGLNKQLNFDKMKTVSPYSIVAENNRYYLICFDHDREIINNLRLDRIAEVTILSEKRKSIKDIEELNGSLNIRSYMQEHLYMVTGVTTKVKLKINNNRIGDLIDWYGKNFKIIKNNGDYSIVMLEVNDNALLFWSLQYYQFVEVISPEEIRNKIKEAALNILKKYN